MEIILAFLLKQLFFQSIPSCQVAGSALTGVMIERTFLEPTMKQKELFVRLKQDIVV
jgi:hypothetical protein